MSSRNVSHLVRACFVCVSLIMACSSNDPCFPASKGKEYRVNVVELWDENSQYANGQGSSFHCPTDFDLVPGGGFTLQVDGFTSTAEGCSCGKAHIIEAPSGWTWDPNSVGHPCRANFVQIEFDGNRDSCNGQVSLEIQASRIPTGISVPGQAPVAYVHRTFQLTKDPDVTSVCSTAGGSCGDRFVVEIEEL